MLDVHDEHVSFQRFDKLSLSASFLSHVVTHKRRRLIRSVPIWLVNDFTDAVGFNSPPNRQKI